MKVISESQCIIISYIQDTMIICITITIYLMVVILVDTYDTFNIFCVYTSSEILTTYEINAVITRCLNLRCRQKLAHLE